MVAPILLEGPSGVNAGPSVKWVTVMDTPLPWEQAGAEAERHRTLLEINNAIISNLTREALFRSIARALRRVLPFDRTAIFLHDRERDVLTLFVLESSLPSEYFTVGLEMAPGESHVGKVFQHRRPLLRRDLEKEREYPAEDLALADGVRSYMIVPLVARGTAVGTLAVASTTPSQYSQPDVGFLQEVANQVALAIENMKSYEEIAALNATIAATAERYRTLLEINNAIISNLTREALFHSVARALRRVVAFDRTAIFLHAPGEDVLRLFILESTLPSGRYVVGLEWPIRESHAGWVFQRQQPLLRSDLEKERQYPTEDLLLADGVRSYLVVPLVVRGRSIGTLNLNSATPDQYSASDAAFLQEVASQVALAVENMKSYEEIAALTARLEDENVYLQEEIRRDHNFAEIVGSSPALLAVLRRVEQVAPTDSTVLIYGETGTGKELIARALHDRSRRRDRPLVKVNCAAISAGLVESELFGHVKGAFTGALERRVGRFEVADGGTIFLDEVSELPPETQVKLLRVLQEREFEPVGSNRTVRVNVRIIAATNRDLEEAIRAGRFRSDLFYRLNVFPLELPPLRERPSDIPQLVTFFLSRFSTNFGRHIDVSQDTMDRLVAYSWPGNIRELQNVLERAVVLSQGSTLELDLALRATREPRSGGVVEGEGVAATSPAGVGDAPAAGPGAVGLATFLEETERRHIVQALKQAGGVIEGPKGAARILKLHPNTLRSRMEKLEIRRSGHEVP
jgi:formate hydrogenlyase transcriptional activator